MNVTTAAAPAARYSTRELQAAAAALAAGRFSAPTAAQPAAVTAETVTGPPTWTHDRASEHGVKGAAKPTGTASDAIVQGPLVRVQAASAGAGASTISLAFADAADAAGTATRVLDAAAPGWSGLLGATATELGASDGWRRGRRGAGVLIDRVDEPICVASQVPTPRPVDGIDLTVLDVGWSPRELAAHPQAWVTATPVAAEVLVTRPHALALSQAEVALGDLADKVAAGEVVLVIVGAARWSERDFTMAGRVLRAVRDQDALVFAPVLSTKTLPGLGPDPLPKQLSTPAQRLLERVTTITGPLTANRT